MRLRYSRQGSGRVRSPTGGTALSQLCVFHRCEGRSCAAFLLSCGGEQSHTAVKADVNILKALLLERVKHIFIGPVARITMAVASFWFSVF